MTVEIITLFISIGSPLLYHLVARNVIAGYKAENELLRNERVEYLKRIEFLMEQAEGCDARIDYLKSHLRVQHIEVHETFSHTMEDEIKQVLGEKIGKIMFKNDMVHIQMYRPKPAEKNWRVTASFEVVEKLANG